MSKTNGAGSPSEDPEGSPQRGPNLTLIYGVIILAMIAALAIAAMIVLPFYNRR